MQKSAQPKCHHASLFVPAIHGGPPSSRCCWSCKRTHSFWCIRVSYNPEYPSLLEDPMAWPQHHHSWRIMSYCDASLHVPVSLKDMVVVFNFETRISFSEVVDAPLFSWHHSSMVELWRILHLFFLAFNIFMYWLLTSAIRSAHNGDVENE